MRRTGEGGVDTQGEGWMKQWDGGGGGWGGEERDINSRGQVEKRGCWGLERERERVGR